MKATPNRSKLAAAIGAATFALLATPAIAQDEPSSGWTVTVGIGGQINPQYPGADSYTVAPTPIFGLRRAGRPLPFYAQDDGAGFGILGNDSVFNFGPAASLRGRRRNDDVGAPVGNVGYTIELGGFAEVYPVHGLRLRGEVRQGINGHKGLVGNVGADIVVRDEDTYIFAIGPRARWADDDFHAAYFGVTPAVATATGLTAFTPRSGFYAYGAESSITYRVGRNWGIRAFAGYDRLTRDAARSPIVRTYGSRDQFSGGIGPFIEFHVGGH